MIETERLVLRPWREVDVAPFHTMGQDGEAMRYLGPSMSWADARAAHDRIVACRAQHGHIRYRIGRPT